MPASTDGHVAPHGRGRGEGPWYRAVPRGGPPVNTFRPSEHTGGGGRGTGREKATRWAGNARANRAPLREVRKSCLFLKPNVRFRRPTVVVIVYRNPACVYEIGNQIGSDTWTRALRRDYTRYGMIIIITQRDYAKLAELRLSQLCQYINDIPISVLLVTHAHAYPIIR